MRLSWLTKLVQVSVVRCTTLVEQKHLTHGAGDAASVLLKFASNLLHFAAICEVLGWYGGLGSLQARKPATCCLSARRAALIGPQVEQEAVPDVILLVQRNLPHVEGFDLARLLACAAISLLVSPAIKGVVRLLGVGHASLLDRQELDAGGIDVDLPL